MADINEATAEILLENEVFRVTKWTLAPGETIPMHVHEHEYVVIPMLPTPMEVTPAGEDTFVFEMVPGTSYSRPKGSEHQIHNPSRTDTVQFIEVEAL